MSKSKSVRPTVAEVAYELEELEQRLVILGQLWMRLEHLYGNRADSEIIEVHKGRWEIPHESVVARLGAELRELWKKTREDIARLEQASVVRCRPTST